MLNTKGKLQPLVGIILNWETKKNENHSVLAIVYNI